MQPLVREFDTFKRSVKYFLGMIPDVQIVHSPDLIQVWIVNQKCEVCGNAISARKKTAKYCSEKCKNLFWTERAKSLSPNNKVYNLSTGSIGAIAELMVCVDMMAMGYEVFRAISPSCSSDLIALKKSKAIRIEVRTGRYMSNKSVWYSKIRLKSDVVAVVTHIDKKIHYYPDLSSHEEDNIHHYFVCANNIKKHGTEQ